MKKQIIMKKIAALLMSTTLVITCLIAPAGAFHVSEADTPIAPIETIQPRRNVVMTHTESVYVGSNEAEVTIYYTTRLEESNSSQLYITGVMRGTIKNVSGWLYVTDLDVDIYGLVYSHNHQKVVVPITYRASVGDGYTTYSDSITIDLLS